MLRLEMSRYKDDVQINSTGDSMIVNSVNENDEGKYMCRVENIAGVVKSNEAYLRVVDAYTYSFLNDTLH
ncbi:hypothetical protein ACF0H5_015786 [Mactra antiquata]